MLKRVSTVMLAAGALLLTACSSGPAPTTEQVVQVTGQGEVKAEPNEFHVQAVASRTGDNVAKMKKSVDKEINQALKAAAEIGIEERYITATGFSVQPEWEWEPKKKLVGQQVQRNLRFIVHGVDNYAAILEALSDIGFYQISNSNATLSNPDAVRQEALEKAVADAKEKAQVLAKASGRKLGPALQINEQGSNTPQPMMRAMAMSADAATEESAQFSPGEITVRHSVNVLFQLK